jgi:hypothetical protein
MGALYVLLTNTLALLLLLFVCSSGTELPLRATLEKCGYPSGLLSIASETFLGSTEHDYLTEVAQCLAQSAIQIHGMYCLSEHLSRTRIVHAASGAAVKPLSAAQAKDEAITRKFRGWQYLWQSGEYFLIPHPGCSCFFQHGFCIRSSEIGMRRRQPVITKIYFMYFWPLALQLWNML